jgi:hypothetical protein
MLDTLNNLTPALVIGGLLFFMTSETWFSAAPHRGLMSRSISPRPIRTTAASSASGTVYSARLEGRKSRRSRSGWSDTADRTTRRSGTC